ncbi:hypothetical protein V5F32_20910 [Xanthobacter oligotrophicus]|uniref:DUF91 domain-containing protein n=1 Tax=Xanthobacter oligotrophicus TaxID=2607286 RepID=A0ABW7A0V5_9HYPH
MTLQAGVFVLQGSDDLVAMQPEQFSTEVDFQKMLSKFPSLLVGDQINPDNPRRFLLIKQELTIGHEGDPTRWSLDHLFLDQDGVPTLVEVKRQSDSRLRREVVGQMLDYAANFQSFWNADKIMSAFELGCSINNIEYIEKLNEFIGSEITDDQFWSSVETNIRAGKIRLIFVSDHIPSELRRIVEFLNEQMTPAEVLALELRQFVGQGLRTIVPVIFGQTQEAASRKEPGRGERWTEERLIAAFDSKFPASEAAVAKAIITWMKSSGFPLAFGTGRTNGSVYPLLKPKGVAINPAYLSTEGKVWLQLKSLQGKPVFGGIDERRELLRHFAQVEGSGLTEAAADGWPAISLDRIAADPQGTDKVLSALQWIVDRVKEAV